MRNPKRMFALLLALCLTALCTACGKTAAPAEVPAETQTAAAPAQPQYTDAPSTLRKAETVYVNLDNAGAVRTVTVTDWLHTDKGAVAATDKSDLTDIRDIKGSTVARKQGDALVWDMATTDLYYQGVSDKQLPVSFSLRYRLDGKEMSAEKIAGRSGKAQIEVTMENLCAQDGVYLPVIAAGVMILPEGRWNSLSLSLWSYAY